MSKGKSSSNRARGTLKTDSWISTTVRTYKEVIKIVQCTVRYFQTTDHVQCPVSLLLPYRTNLDNMIS